MGDMVRVGCFEKNKVQVLTKVGVISLLAVMAPIAIAGGPKKPPKRPVKASVQQRPLVPAQMWVFSGKDGSIKASPGERMPRAAKGDWAFNAYTAGSNVVWYDDTGYFTLGPGARVVLDINTADIIGVYVEEGWVQATEYANAAGSPRRRRQRTASTVSVAPGGSKIHRRSTRPYTNWSRFEVVKDLSQDIVKVQITCNERSVSVSKNGGNPVLLKPGRSYPTTE